jgi:hypothetical protein
METHLIVDISRLNRSDDGWPLTTATEAIVPFESTGLAIIAGRSLQLQEDLSPHSYSQSVPPAV